METAVLLVWRREDYSTRDLDMLETRKLWKISTILAGFLFLVLLTWPPFFDVSLISFYAYLLFLVIMLGVIAFYVGKDSPLPSLSLFVLGLTLSVSCLGMLDITLDGWRLTDSISYDLTSRAGYAERLFFESVIPPTVGLIFVLIALVLNKKNLTRMFRGFPLLSIGSAVAGLGAIFFNDAYGHYVNPSYGVWGPNAAAAVVLLREIFLVYMLAGVVWIGAGALLVTFSLGVIISKRYPSRKPSTENKTQTHAKLEQILTTEPIQTSL